MPLAKCERCEKLFAKTDNPICPNCVPDEERDHEIVRSCLSDHPNLNAEAISELTGVSIQCVLRMIDQGQVTNSIFTGAIKCGKCGAPAISASKKLCNACLEEMNRRVAKQRMQLQEQAMKVSRSGDGVTVRQMIDEKRRP
jgi:ribosomal protein L37E